MNELSGEEVQDYTYQTAFEYQQNDFHFFRLKNVLADDKIREVKKI